MLIISTGALAEEPLKVNFTVLSALIGPTKVNGKTWDPSAGFDTTSSSIITEMVVPGAGVFASTVISAMSRVAAQGQAAPDVIGFIVQTGITTTNLKKIAFIPMKLANTRNISRDSYTPRFQTGYSGWPIFKDTRFQIQLWDFDMIDPDPIGVIELTYENIIEAIEKGKPIWINVAEQSMNQLLFVQITASFSLKSTAPKMNGYKW